MPIPKDENRVPATAGLSTSGNSILPFMLDSVTGRLLCKQIVGSASDPTGSANVKRDENWVVIGYGVSSANSKTLLPIRVDASTGALLCKAN